MTVITTENFEQEVIGSEKLTVLDFWATWCGPCMMLSPIMEELDAEMPDVKFCKCNVDEQMELAMQFRIESIPTLLLVKNGKVVNKLVGFREKSALIKDIEDAK
ncbi:MAG: thioredoxin [Clostridia bacterium]|nr:thioredoxin [Clostridia bacterium]